jgi:hypothetical protein
MMHPLLYFLSAVLADFTLLTPGQYTMRARRSVASPYLSVVLWSSNRSETVARLRPKGRF